MNKPIGKLLWNRAQVDDLLTNPLCGYINIKIPIIMSNIDDIADNDIMSRIKHAIYKCINKYIDVGEGESYKIENISFKRCAMSFNPTSNPLPSKFFDDHYCIQQDQIIYIIDVLTLFQSQQSFNKVYNYFANKIPDFVYQSLRNVPTKCWYGDRETDIIKPSKKDEFLSWCRGWLWWW